MGKVQNGADQEVLCGREGEGSDNPQVQGIVVASFDKSVEPNEELKVEQIFSQVLSATDTTLRTLDVHFT